MAGLQQFDRLVLGGIRLEAALLQGMLVGGKGGVEGHGAALCGLRQGMQALGPAGGTECGGDFNR
ncbi:hypothetical protein D9M68_837810 [compost metagenome]